MLRATSTLLLTLIAITAIGCSKSARINTEGTAEISRLNEKYEVLARLGAPPIELEQGEQLARFAIYEKGKSPNIFVILAPDLADGDISIPQRKQSEESGEGIESATRYNRYIDMVLRAHRLLLRGDMDEAVALIDHVDENYGKTFGTLILRANIAHIKGEKYNAQKYFKLAVRIHPEANTSKTIQEKLK